MAVICAHNLRNSGMYSVDLAARHFFQQQGLKHELFVTQERSQVGALRYRLVRDLNDLRGHDTSVYWGDFLNNLMWRQADCAVRHVARHGVGSLNAAFDNWRRLYLPNENTLPASTCGRAGIGRLLHRHGWRAGRCLAEGVAAAIRPAQHSGRGAGSSFVRSAVWRHRR